mgnify:CR=1 FL=1
MAAISRILDINLPEGQSAFLWGARKTGKSTYLQTRFPGSMYLDLLKTDVAIDLLRRPALLRERLAARSAARCRKRQSLLYCFRGAFTSEK